MRLYERTGATKETLRITSGYRSAANTAGGAPKLVATRCIDGFGDATIPIANLIAASYRLEVSSPGLDRLLAREKDFAAACGSEVRIETHHPVGNQRRFRGLLRDFARGIATLVVEGREVEIPFADIAKGNTVYKFSRADFAREVDPR